MTVERRKAEASGLRNLFSRQWAHLSGLIDSYGERRAARKQQDADELQAVENVVDATDTRMRLVSGYRNKLRLGVRTVLQYVDTLVAELPDALEVTQDRFLHDPQVNAFFVNKRAIEEVFSRSHDLQEFFDEPLNSSRDHVYAVLFMSCREREVLGMSMDSGLLTRDVKQTTVSFTDHHLVQPSVTEAQARSALERFLFESFVEYVDYRLARLHAAGEGGKNLSNPAVYLEEICAILEQPEDMLRLDASVIRINRIGVKVAEDAKEVASDLTLFEISLGSHAHDVVTLVSFPRDEMVSRDTLLHRAHMGLGPGGH